MIPVALVISVISFIIIQLPPGDYIESYITQLEDTGATVTAAEREIIEGIRRRYGLDRPIIEQYLRWMGNVLRGDLGYSMSLGRPVAEVVWGRMGMTLVVTVAALLFTWILAFPIGFYSAVHQYTFGDYIFTFIGFIGLAVPNFMLALFFLYFGFVWSGQAFTGLFSPELQEASWSLAKLVDLMKHLWIPMIVVGTAGTAGLIRVMRNNLLDELKKPYVTTARAKGLKEWQLLWRYPVRIAINPFLSTAGWILPHLISGATITAVVLNLPTAGATLLNALLVQDMFLAGAIVMLMAMLTLIGTLISDILLALVDPRIRYAMEERE
jgi:peptide/nickel transport system permease protein